MMTERLAQSVDVIGATFERLKSLDVGERETGCEYIGEKLGAEAAAQLRERLAQHDALAKRAGDITAELKKAPPTNGASALHLVEPSPKTGGFVRRDLGARPQPQPEPTGIDASGPPRLSASAPYDTAKEFAERECKRDGKIVVWFWQGEFWRWNGKHYAPERDEEMRGKVYRFLDGALRWVGDQAVRFQPNPRHVNEVLDALKTGLALGVECQPPMWISTGESATQWIVFQNGVVNVETSEVRELTPDLWAHSALGFDWQPDAPAPRWEQFLAEVFPDDAESGACIEELMGYCMTEETRFQKGALFVGPKRSGKGTISHVLRQLVGDGSYVGLSFSNWVASENSRQCLIGKRVGVFADVRFKPGRAYGRSYDPGGIGHVSAEFLLNIIGEDTVTIPRKYLAPWHGQLRIKMLLISNEIPNLNDTSGVLPSRFIKIHFGISFFGREDASLRPALTAELPGIAARCVAAYQRLCARGRFTQPKSGAKLEQDLVAASDPMAAMAQECFVLNTEASCTKVAAYARFIGWCHANQRPDLLATPQNKFGGKLRQVAGFENIGECKPHGQQRRWVGFALAPKEGL